MKICPIALKLAKVGSKYCTILIKHSKIAANDDFWFFAKIVKIFQIWSHYLHLILNEERNERAIEVLAKRLKMSFLFDGDLGLRANLKFA